MAAVGNPVRSVEEKPRPTVTVDAKHGKNQFRIVISHAIVGRRGGEGSAPEIQIDGSYELIYSVPDNTDLTQAEVEAFAETNALLNCWPYWRELVQSTIARMGLPPLVLPLFRLMPVKEEKSSNEHDEQKDAAPQKKAKKA
jgi:preprotein translocase subunit SecB